MCIFIKQKIVIKTPTSIMNGEKVKLVGEKSEISRGKKLK